MSDQGKDLRPARGYLWEPFEAGNEAGLKFGAYSDRRIGERAALIVPEVLALAPHLNQPEFEHAVSSYAMARARLELLTVALENAITAGGLKSYSRLAEDANAASREEMAQRASLGLDPRSRAELRQIGSLTDLNEALVLQILPELPWAFAVAMEEMGMGNRAEELTTKVVAALRAAPEKEGD